jgi:hypothetical protein
MMKRCFISGIVLCGTLLGLGRGEAFQAVSTNLAGYWPMDTIAAGSTPDASGNNHPATQGTAGSQPGATPGMFNGALNFDDTADFLSVADSAILNVGTGNFTVAAWVKPSGTSTDRVINKWNGTLGWLMDINTGSGGAGSPGFLRLKMNDGTNNIDYFVNAGLVTGAWTHVAATVDRTAKQLKLYANGTQIGTTQSITALTGTLTNTAALGIGTIPSAVGNYYGGALDEVRLYSAALTQAQVLTLIQPLPPTGLTATPLQAYNARPVDLAWAASAGSLSYNVYRSTVSGSGYVQIASGLMVTTYADALPAYDTTYYYVVRGFNTVEGNNSNEAFVMIHTPPKRTQKIGSEPKCGIGSAGDPGWTGAGVALLILLLAALRRPS